MVRVGGRQNHPQGSSVGQTGSTCREISSNRKQFSVRCNLFYEIFYDNLLSFLSVLFVLFPMIGCDPASEATKQSAESNGISDTRPTPNEPNRESPQAAETPLDTKPNAEQKSKADRDNPITTVEAVVFGREMHVRIHASRCRERDRIVGRRLQATRRSSMMGRCFRPSR